MNATEHRILTTALNRYLWSIEGTLAYCQQHGSHETAERFDEDRQTLQSLIARHVAEPVAEANERE